MSKLHIFTDSASDITLKEMEELDVELVPLTLTIKQESLLDDKTMDSAYLWDLLESGESIKTSQPSPEAFIEAFQKAKDNGEDSIFISVSSRLSGTYQCSMLAKDLMEYENLYCIDSLSATLGQKELVYRACTLRNEGKSTQEIVDELNRAVPKIKIFAVLDTLEYLARSGRISKGVAGIGDVVKVKPMVTIIDGKVELTKLVRGKKKGMAELRKIFESANIDEKYPIIPVYSKNVSNCLDLIEPLDLNPLSPQELGMTIGTHIGPGAYGLIYVEK